MNALSRIAKRLADERFAERALALHCAGHDRIRVVGRDSTGRCVWNVDGQHSMADEYEFGTWPSAGKPLRGWRRKGPLPKGLAKPRKLWRHA